MVNKTISIVQVLALFLSVAASAQADTQSYSGGWMTRPKLTGDWGGVRDQLRAKGVTLDVDFISIGQGVNTGGLRRNWEYNGEALFDLNVDTGKLGLWPGGYLRILGESQFGSSINGDTGTITAANTAALFPIPGQEITTLSNLSYTQFLNNWLGIFGGKLDTATNGDLNEFASDRGKTRFMNVNLNANPVTFLTSPYSVLGGGIILMLPDQKGQVAFTVLDPNGNAGRAGFDRAFDNGASAIMEGRIKTRFFGLPGHQLIGATGSSKTFIATEQDPRLLPQIISNPGLLNRSDNSWSVYYNFDQFLFTESDDPTQGIGLFGRFGWADAKTNLAERFYSLGIGGKGIIPTRDRDTFGVGFWYIETSNHLKDLLSVVSDSTGGEIYYNAELTPWLHVTPDIQVISSPLKKLEPAVVTGIRLMVNF